MNLNDPIIRFLAWMIAIAVAIRVIFDLLAPVAPHLLAALIIFVLLRLRAWHRGRW